jgi:hypothetical protein
MPAGQRCDGGRARGLFQLHLAACRKAYEWPDGTIESFREEVRCVDRQLRHHASRVMYDLKACSEPDRAAFTGYAGRRCDWKGALPRLATSYITLKSLLGLRDAIEGESETE